MPSPSEESLESTGVMRIAVPLPEQPDYEAVARISTQAELRTIRLCFLHADIDENKVAIPADWSGQAATGFNVQIKIDRSMSRLVVFCGFLAIWAPGLQADGPPQSPQDAPFELHARFELAYGLKQTAGIRDADPAHFAWTNAMLHAWPYWRELAHDMTVRMGLAPLLVGTIKVPWTGDPDPQAQLSDKTDA